MHFDMTQPCKDCPFRNDITFYLHPARRQEIATALLFGDSTFACHKTVDYGRWEDEDTEEYTHSGDEHHCAGALIVLTKSDRLWWNKLFRLARLFGWLDPKKLNLEAPVFGSMEEFVDGSQ